MEEIVSGLMSIAILFAIVYAFFKAVLAPIHEKLDRLLAPQDRSCQSREARATESPLGARLLADAEHGDGAGVRRT